MDNKNNRQRRVVSTKAVTVIEVKVRIGCGTEDDPNRIETEYWSTEGELLAIRQDEVSPVYGVPLPPVHR